MEANESAFPSDEDDEKEEMDETSAWLLCRRIVVYMYLYALWKSEIKRSYT